MYGRHYLNKRLSVCEIKRLARRNAGFERWAVSMFFPNCVIDPPSILYIQRPISTFLPLVSAVLFLVSSRYIYIVVHLAIST